MDNNNFPDIDGLLGSIRNVATPVGHAAGTTTARGVAPGYRNPVILPNPASILMPQIRYGRLSWKTFRPTVFVNGKTSGRSA